MSTTTWSLFLLISLTTAFSPGPAVVLAISNAVAVGGRRAMLGSLGNASGVLCVSLLAATGLGLVLKSSAHAFAALKIAGAAYLIFLGIRQWMQRGALVIAQDVEDGEAQVSRSELFSRAFVVAVTNPKSILFFTALFPQFIRPSAGDMSMFVLLTLTFAACTILSHLFYIGIASVSGQWFRTPSRVLAFNRTSGVAYLLLGVGMLRIRQTAH